MTSSQKYVEGSITYCPSGAAVEKQHLTQGHQDGHPWHSGI